MAKDTNEQNNNENIEQQNPENMDLQNSENIEQQNPYQDNDIPTIPEPKKKSGLGIILFIIVVGFVIVFGFKEHIVRFFLSHKTDKNHHEVVKPVDHTPPSITIPNSNQHPIPPATVANNNQNMQQTTLTPSEKQEIENIVKNYIQDHPDVILDSLKNMEQKIIKERSDKAKDYVKENITSINNNKPFIGNPNGNIVITKFFDYKCGYCKKSHTALETLLKNIPNLKVVLIELPIMGQQSLIATQASLAVFDIAQTKFAKFNSDLMTLQNIDENAIKTLAMRNNINVKNLFTAMKSQKVEQEIDMNMSIARDVGLQGVPAFIIGDEFIPGFIDYNTLKAKVEKLQRQ